MLMLIFSDQTHALASILSTTSNLKSSMWGPLVGKSLAESSNEKRCDGRRLPPITSYWYAPKNSIIIVICIVVNSVLTIRNFFVYKFHVVLYFTHDCCFPKPAISIYSVCTALCSTNICMTYSNK